MAAEDAVPLRDIAVTTLLQEHWPNAVFMIDNKVLVNSNHKCPFLARHRQKLRSLWLSDVYGKVKTFLT